MTIPNNEEIVEVDQKPQRTIPEIKAEEDLPFPTEQPQKLLSRIWKPADKKLGKTDDLTKFRFETGRTVLYIAMFAMAVMVGLDLWSTHFLKSTSDLIESAFEAFKLITMTVLGYIFGSNSSKE